MKSMTRLIAILAALFFASATLSTECIASSGIKQATESSSTLQTVEDDYLQAAQMTSATEDALDELRISAGIDLAQSFEVFSKNYEWMEQIGEQLVKHADGMYFRGTNYFVEPVKPLEACPVPGKGKSEDLRSIDLGENFDPILEASGKVKRAFRAFQFDIEQIHEYLANNLTLAGIDTMALMLRKATVDSGSLEETLQQAQKAVQHAKATMAQAAPK